jgi:hypothetical protein
VLAAVFGLLLADAAHAHEARPGFLELRETGAETWSLLWKKPTGGEVEIQIAPVVPEGCRLATPDRQQVSPGAVIVRGTLRCPGGIAGKTIAIAGLQATITDVLVRVHHADGRLESHLLRPVSPRSRADSSAPWATSSSACSTSCWVSTTCCSCWGCC